jgi:hypothetical protein
MADDQNHHQKVDEMDRAPYRASSSTMAVVAVKTDKGIIRTIASQTGLKEMVDELVNQIGALNLANTEWTGFTYGLPYYAVGYLSVPNGIYLWPWVRPPADGPKYRGDRSHLGITGDPVLLHRPRGWATKGHNVFSPLQEAIARGEAR